MYKKDAVWFGVVIGLLAPPLFYGLLFLINLAIIEVFYEHYAIRPKTMALLSIFINLLPTIPLPPSGFLYSGYIL